jgi:hypothetical protein
MYTVLLNYRKGKLDDPMNGQVNDPRENMMQQDFVFKEFDHLFMICSVVV